MNELTGKTAIGFFKQFRLRGGRLQRVRIQPRPRDATTAEIRLVAIDNATGQPAKLRLLFAGVVEYRFQRRPGQGVVRLNEVQVGFFDDLTYLNFDALPEDGPPKVMDFRASDCFIAARTVTWESVASKSTT